MIFSFRAQKAILSENSEDFLGDGAAITGCKWR
jgi:hypothetical protein